MSTLTLEVLAPFTVQQHGQVTTWYPGQRMILSHEKARRVLASVGTKVRLLAGDRLGHIVTWTSPWLWGAMRATVLEDLGHGVRVVHPVTGVTCVIPTAWLTNNEPQPVPDTLAGSRRPQADASVNTLLEFSDETPHAARYRVPKVP